MESFRAAAPVRADLSGGTLDLWPLYTLLGRGRTINVALDLRATAHFEWLPSVAFGAEIQAVSGEKASFDEPLGSEEIAKLAPALRFPVAVVSEYLKRRESIPEKSLRIRLETQAPIGSGLGGSSALCVALVRGLSRIFSDFVELGWQWQMLGWVKDMEAGFLKTPTGTQDYLAALFGGVTSYVSRIGGIDREGYPDEVLDGLSERLVVLFSGEMHHSGLSNWELYKKALEGDATVLGGLERIAEISEKLHALLLAPSLDWRAVGRCLSDEWDARRTTFQVQTPRLDEIVRFLSGKDVLGVKVCGAAQGGSLIALVEPSGREALTRACEEAKIQVLAARPTREGVQIVDPKRVRQPVF